MPEFLSQQINPPADWQAFERLCQDIWKNIWNDPNTQRNGRAGQAQHGVDVYGRTDGDGDLNGVQCKGKNTLLGAAVTEQELRDEVDKAKNFKPKISSFILATTAASDQAIQRVANELTELHNPIGLFSVAVFGWEEIHQRLADYPDLIDKHFPGQGPILQRISDSVDQLLISQLQNDARQSPAVEELASVLVQELAGRGILPLSADEETDPSDQALNSEIDSYRDRIKTMPKTALSLLEDLRERSWEAAAQKTRFRILTNIGSAHVELSQWQQACALFFEAAKFTDKDDPKATMNLAFAHTMSGDYVSARIEAEKAIKLDPENPDGYALLIAASRNVDDKFIPENLVPEKFHDAANVSYTIGHSYRHKGDQDKAIEWSRRAYSADNTSIQYRASYAAELLGKVFGQVGASLEGYLSEDEVCVGSHSNHFRRPRGILFSWSRVRRHRQSLPPNHGKS